MKNRITTYTLAMFAAATLTACADMKMTPVSPVPAAVIASVAAPAAAPSPAAVDAALADTVRAMLKGNATLGGSNLTVAVAKNQVTLTGDVETGQQLVAVAKAVQSVKGVTAVIPNINVKR